MIPFVDLKTIHQPLQKQFQQVMDHCLSESDFVTGPMVRLFEQDFANYCESKHCIGVSSGTAALFLALQALGIKEGDEVIVPAHTFIATAMAVSQCGATPIFVDVDEYSWNISWKNISEKINSKTKAIIVVHIYGNPVEIEKIVTAAHQQAIPVIEDAAQAHGALYQNKKIGSLADIACFSFYPSKNLGALGEGGAITTNNEELAQTVSQLRDYGRSDKYKHEKIGYNLRLQGMQAGFLSVKLKHLDQWNERRREVMEIYQKQLKDTSLQFQSISSDAVPVYHLGVIQTSNRAHITKTLQDHQIGFGVHYPIPCHQQPAYSETNHLSLPIAERLSKSVLSLPLFVGLEKQQIDTVCEVIKTCL
ncbi:MAG TPA: DegT/DnrJ/EryC1/StrS family aminotransferase [Chitinophagales bacterium]|nr:DegT/DnrJ/EryC1/StrS family aminotransferase [Chitinophagales bacterium]